MRIRGLIIIFIITARVVSGQIPDTNPETVWNYQPQLMDSIHHQSNFYDFADNPAALYEDAKSKMLMMGQNTELFSGGYHLPFSPQRINDQNYTVLTVYPLSEKDLFKGYFGYHSRIDSDVLWADQSRWLEVNPFILGDSSKGDFKLNGLFWSAEWAHRFSEKWLTGIGFFYNVDERLKQVFPKPLNKHRDIRVKSGVQYSKKNWKLGFTYHYDNAQEKVELSRYNLDQQLTPTIYKFRYSDLPVIMRGKTSEEREVNFRTHKFGIQLSSVLDNFNLLFSTNYSFNHSEVFDGGTQRVLQGEFELESLSAEMRLSYRRAIWESYLNYKFYYSNLTSYHPDFGMTVLKEPSATQCLQTGLKLSLNSRLSVYSDLIYSHFWDTREDLMTDNYWRYQIYTYGFRTGADYLVNNRWELGLWGGASFIDAKNLDESNQAYTDYFDILYRQKLEYYVSGNMEIISGARIIFHYLPLLDVEASSQYYTHLADDHFSSGTHRDFWAMSLRLKLYVF